MIRTCFRFFFFMIIGSCFLPGTLKGQSATVSPYSRYGIGDLDDQPGILGFSMGNTGTALHGDSLLPYYANLKNPAACYYNRVTTFEAGFLNNNMNISSGGQNNSSDNMYFSYFDIAMPMGKNFGLSLGLAPMSSLGYDILTSSSLDSAGIPVGSNTNEYNGSGGLSRAFAYLAGGFHVGRWFSFAGGLNGSYLFGNLTNTQTITYPLNYSAFNGIRTQNAALKGFTLSYGAMMSFYLPKKWEIILGGTLALNSNINAMYNLLTTNNMNGVTYDTIQDSSATGKVRLPMMYSGGLTIKKGNNWTFTFDYTVQNWSQYSYFGEQQNLNNSTQMGFGVEYHPIPGEQPTYFKRVYYRAGFLYNQSYLDLNNTQLNEYALSLGVGLPIGQWNWPWPIIRVNVLNVGLQLGQFGTTSNNLLREDYFKLMIGFTFDDRWFIKRQYE